jgi:heme iron utilization protein
VSELSAIVIEGRRLLRRSRSGALATGDGDGSPYASLVTVAWDHDGAPLFLLSDLADHTRNLAADARSSLLVEAASRRANPQTGPRISLVGRIAVSDEPRHRRRFLARHPEATVYAGFADFRVYTMAVEKGHWVGGFARAHWMAGHRLLLSANQWHGIAACETDVVDHMNDDHGESVDHYARVLLGRRGTGWRMTGIDPEGIDLARGGRHARLDFEAPVTDATSCRERLVALVKMARADAK